MAAPEQTDTRGNFITTYSGAKFFIDECNIWDIPFEDIAHSLSMNCRFNGHVKYFYSVAEHSVIVSYLVPRQDALWGLLHDVTEAFCTDIPRPFKSLITGFDEFEEKLAKNVARHFGLPEELPDSVKYIDKNIVANEAAVLFKSPPDWLQFYDDVGARSKIIGLMPDIAEQEFTARYHALRG